MVVARNRGTRLFYGYYRSRTGCSVPDGDLCKRLRWQFVHGDGRLVNNAILDHGQCFNIYGTLEDFGFGARTKQRRFNVPGIIVHLFAGFWTRLMWDWTYGEFLNKMEKTWGTV